MSRSIFVKSEYLIKVKSSLLRNGFPSQKLLAEALGLAQSTVSHFLNGKPVDYINFLEICQQLGYDWRDIANLDDKLETANLPTHNQSKILIVDRAFYQPITQELQLGLIQQNYQVFIDNSGENQLNLCDYLLLIISSKYLLSEIILDEIKQILELRQKTAILPIFLDLPLNLAMDFDLLKLLENIQPWSWEITENTGILVNELIPIIRNQRTQLPADHRLAFNWSNLMAPTELAKPQAIAPPELPGGQVDLSSQFYIERYPIELQCYETILQPGSLIRIKAPRQMGKTSLLARILHHAERHNSRTIALSFQLANKKVLANSDTFLQWFCASIGQELGLLDHIPQYWQLVEMIGSNQCCKAYFEQCLLPAIKVPLTLGLDEVDRVFESPEIADDFFGLLRALHEEAKRRPIWKNLRLIVVHSTEVYIPLDVNKSPFNVGLPIELPEFNQEQIAELARRYGLEKNLIEIEQLTDLVGGHPYLLRLGMYKLARQEVTLTQLIGEATKEGGIYSDHLRRHLWNLEKNPALYEAMTQVVKGGKNVKLRSDLAFKLNSMGLIKLEGNYCIVRSALYQQYFLERL